RTTAVAGGRGPGSPPPPAVVVVPALVLIESPGMPMPVGAAPALAPGFDVPPPAAPPVVAPPPVAPPPDVVPPPGDIAPPPVLAPPAGVRELALPAVIAPEVVVPLGAVMVVPPVAVALVVAVIAPPIVAGKPGRPTGLPPAPATWRALVAPEPDIPVPAPPKAGGLD